MTIRRFKECRECGTQQPRGWTESADYICLSCTMRLTNEAARKEAESKGYRTALRSDPTRRSLRNQGDDLDPLNPLSLTSPLNPAHQDWDSSSHRNREPVEHDTWGVPRYSSSDSHRSHSSHDDGGIYDSGSSDSGSSSGGCD